MKPPFYFSIVKYAVVYCFVFLILGCDAQEYKLNEGDIIFQTTDTKQTKLIKELTHSDITHCGLVYKKGDKFYVIHAVDPVSSMPFETWIARGVKGKYKVIRLKKTFGEEEKKKMFDFAKKQIGKPYDKKFEWSNSKMYCSEFVWKVFDSVGITLCEPKKFSDYDLDNQEAQNAIKNRYKGDINFEEKVVTPVDLLKSPLGELVYDGY